MGSVNHLLDGAPKVWFVVAPIAPNNRDEFVDGLRKLFPKEYKMCSQYHRHQIFLVDSTR